MPRFNTREYAIALWQAGLADDVIADKLEIKRNTLNRYLRPVRGPLRASNRNWTSPDGKPLRQWLEENNIKSIPISTIIGRLHMGWEFYDAVYRAPQTRSRHVRETQPV